MQDPLEHPTSNIQHYESVAHTADLALHVWGKDLVELFANAARGIFAAMTETPTTDGVERRVELDAVDAEALLVDWLNELIYLHETEGETYTDFVMEHVSPTHLLATIHGGPTSEKTLVVKAATYHNLNITETPEGVEATVVFDI